MPQHSPILGYQLLWHSRPDTTLCQCLLGWSGVRPALAIGHSGPALLRFSTGSRRCTLGQVLTAVQLGCAGAPALYRSILSGDASQQRLEYPAHLAISRAPALWRLASPALGAWSLRCSVSFWMSACAFVSCAGCSGAQLPRRSKLIDVRPLGTQSPLRSAFLSNQQFFRLGPQAISGWRSELSGVIAAPWRVTALALGCRGARVLRRLVACHPATTALTGFRPLAVLEL